MQPLTVIPLVGLGAMMLVVALGLRDGPTLVADFGEPPEEADLPSPDLGLGDMVLEGQLLGADGAAVDGASLHLFQNGRPVWTVSDASGYFRLEDLHPGPVEVDVLAPGHMAAVLRTDVNGYSVVLRLVDVLPQIPTLPHPRRFDLQGRIEAANVDLTDFEVALLPAAPSTEVGTGVPRRTKSDSDGNFAFVDLTAAEYEVLVLPQWASSGSWPDLLTGLNEPALRFMHPGPFPLTVVLSAGTIAGNVFEREGGEPVAGGMVVAIPVPESPDSTDLRRFPPTRTDTSGAYRIELLPPGRYHVTLTAGAEVREAEVEVLPGGVVDPGF